MFKDDLSFEYVNSILSYNPETGELRWKAGRRNAGKIAGCIDKTQGYRQINIDGSIYKGSRLAYLLMTGSWPIGMLDHWDKNKSNNIWKNIRVSTNSKNQANREAPINNKSGYKGVVWHKQSQKWRAQIYVDNKQITLGHFKTKEEAALVYNEAALKYFGEFAVFNEIKNE